MKFASTAIRLLLLAGVLAGCATGAAGPKTDAEEAPRRSTRDRSMAAEAYYQYSVAQLQAQAGRFKEAIAPMQEAIKRDPDSAYLWSQLAQWLVRAEQPNEALAAEGPATTVNEEMSEVGYAKVHCSAAGCTVAAVSVRSRVKLPPTGVDPEASERET